MNNEPNFEEYSYETLLEVYGNICELEYPERKALVAKLIAERKDTDEAKAIIEKCEESGNSPGCLAFIIGGLSFIPLIGVLFGMIAIVWGFAINSKVLKLVGLSGIAFTVIIYSSLGYFSFVQEDGTFDELRSQMAKMQLTSVAQSVEFYKVQNKHYPESLEVLHSSLPENSMVMLFDITQIELEESNFYYYKLIDSEHYHIRSLGRDGIMNTSDDILPDPIENIGLVVNYNEK